MPHLALFLHRVIHLIHLRMTLRFVISRSADDITAEWLNRWGAKRRDNLLATGRYQEKDAFREQVHLSAKVASVDQEIALWNK